MTKNADRSTTGRYLYRLHDWPPGVGPEVVGRLRALGGERRQPRKGEYFISGAIPEAYLAHADMSEVRQIATLVSVERTEAFRITDYNPLARAKQETR